ncbi:TonB-dependent receptor [Sphingosinicella sp. CPCC 101087]|uniref:TonB-dependent receptor n=1 Tax=Sphingosinicella sp. CPCC 101087 TaxID=2497754 RepID=UPI00101BF9A8|nr:TonB-dependent receptor [Sphingosinicella sp. CPCC 101087]
MKTKGALRAGCLVAAALTSGISAPAALMAQAQLRADYDLPAQDLAEALRSIARTSGGEVIFVAEAVQGRRSPPLQGRFTLAEAVRTVVAGTGLVVETHEGAMLVRAPTSAPKAAASGAKEVGITVTGTRIRGTQSPSPVIVMTRRELEEAGASGLADFTRILPQNFSGGQNPGVAGGGDQGGQSNINNSATLNLRGLGPDATLTLVNGHRIAYDALNQGVDISAIPLAAVERIEVIADGASALYGSDAVGGVANIILRRRYDGLQVGARLGGSTAGGNVQQQYSMVGGADWSSGGFMAAYDHGRTTPILAADREYASSLDGSQTLIQRSIRHALVLAGQQALTGGMTLELDAFFNRRRSLKQTPFFADRDVLTDGLVNRPLVRSWAVTPTLRLALPHGWEASISATRAVSRTDIDSRRYTASVEVPQRLIYENRTTGIEANAEGPLFRLPGGAARLAVGGGYRSVLLDVNVAQSVDGTVVTTRDFTDSRGVQFAYGELSLPLVAPEFGLPLIHRLTVSAAVRYERHEGIDEVATPKLGLVYQPHQDVTLRASWGESFKVPTLDQVNLVPEGALLPGRLFSPQPQPPIPAGETVLLLLGGGEGLRAERATTWSTTVELRPRFAEGLRVEATYFDIDYRDRIASPVIGFLAGLGNPIYRDLITFDPAPELVESIVAGLPLGLDNITGQPFDPVLVGAIFDSSIRNAARERARGVDVAMDYDLDLSAGQRLLLSGSASYLESARQLIEGQPFAERAGRIFNPPHWRARFGGTWRSERASFTAFLNYTGPVLDDRRAPLQRIAPFVTVDMSASLRGFADSGPLSGFELRLNVLNLLDERPDLIRNPNPGSVPYDSTNQSPVGRFIGLSLTRSW